MRPRGFTYGLGTNSLGRDNSDGGIVDSQGGSSVTPSALILTWYNSLIVKPSNALLTSLNTLVDGLDADGNWSKLDLFGLIAGMETNEQRLRPLITTSGSDFTVFGSPTLDNNGVNSNTGAGYLDLVWNPLGNGSQFTLNSAFISSYVVDNAYGTYALVPMGSSNTGSFGDTYILYDTTILIGVVNYDGSSPYPSIANGVSSYYCAAVVDGGNTTIYKNAATNTVALAPSNLIADTFFGTDLNLEGSPAGYFGNAYMRHFMAGSGSANQSQIMSRLNTFYAARGL